MKVTEEEIRRFKAVDDEGNVYTVIEKQKFMHAASIDGKQSQAAGSRRLMLPDGEPVNFINDDTFEIVRSHTIIRKVG
jgi:hypothetical protein